MANEDTMSGDNKPDLRADFAQTSSQLREGVNKEMGEARATLSDARDAAYDKASGLAAEAKTFAADKAQAVQSSLAGSLQTFGEALRAAGDQLQEKNQGPAAKLINSAAGGIDGLASSLKDKPLQDMIGEVRKFGRANPTVLIAGSMLAGLALSRFLKSSAPSTPSFDDEGGSSYSPRSSSMNTGPAADPFGGDETLSSFPEAGQGFAAESTGAGAGATPSGAYGSAATSPFELDEPATTGSSPSSTSGTAGGPSATPGFGGDK